MQTLTEFLKSKENQNVILEKIIETLRARGEWGKRGLFTKIGRQFDVSSAYVGQILNGKKDLTLTFIEKIASYLGVSVRYLFGNDVLSNINEQWEQSITGGRAGDISLEEFRSFLGMALFNTSNEDDKDRETSENMYQLIAYFLKIPSEKRKEVIDTLRLLQSGRLEITIPAGIQVKDE